MDHLLRPGNPFELTTDALVLWHCAKQELAYQGLAPEWLNTLQDLLQSGEIQGKKEVTVLHTRGTLPFKRLVVAGLGEASEVSPESFRKQAAMVAGKLNGSRCKEVGFSFLGLPQGLDLQAVAGAVVEGVEGNLYRFSKYFTTKDDNEISLVSVTLVPPVDQADAVRKGLEEGAAIAEAMTLVRNLANEPGNVLTPRYLAQVAVNMAQENGLGIDVKTDDWLRENGFGLMECVGKGSAEPYRLIILKYTGAGPGQPYFGFVGKGITYDTGGISLKPAASMPGMHRDMTGAAMVVAVLKALATLKAPLNIYGVIPAVENMPDGKASRPDDIVKSLNGKFVQILSTDAEGRLVLADALTYTQRELKVTRLLDVATLTGGASYAVGPDICPYLTTSPEMSALLKRAAEEEGETVWELPLHKGYREHIKNPFSDIINGTKRQPSTINGALFLQEFIENDTPWVHMDIASVMDSDKASGYMAKGASGIMARTLVRFFMKLVNA